MFLPLVVLFGLLFLSSAAQQPSAAIILSTPATPPAASTPETLDTLRTRLIGQPLYFRSEENGEHCTYTADGILVPAQPPVSFTVGGIDISSVDRKRDHLVLKGKRVALTFPDNHLLRNTLRQPITIEIAAAPSSAYGPALDRIFFSYFDDVIMTLPMYWRFFAQAYLSRDHLPMPKFRRACGNATTPPRLLTQVEPNYTDAAKHMGLSGNALLTLAVTAEDKPKDIFIVHSVGMGLDEEAIQAVQQYTFTPSKRAGEPVECRVNIDVHFLLR